MGTRSLPPPVRWCGILAALLLTGTALVACDPLFGGPGDDVECVDLAAPTVTPAPLWRPLEVSGERPPARAWHAATTGWFEGTTFVVHGGIGADGTILSDTWTLAPLFGPTPPTWRRVATDGPQLSHAALAFRPAKLGNGTLYLVGGQRPDGTSPLEVWWATIEPDDASISWRRLEIANAPPDPRREPVVTTDPHDGSFDTLFVFGGTACSSVLGGTCIPYGDMWGIEQLETEPSWARLAAADVPMLRRYGHRGAPLDGPGRAFLFGGFGPADEPQSTAVGTERGLRDGLEGNPWHSWDIAGPQQRVADFAMGVELHRGALVTFGGWDESRTLREGTWLTTGLPPALDPLLSASPVTSRYDTGEPSPEPRAGHAYWHVAEPENLLFVHGGQGADGGVLDDLWVLHSASGTVTETITRLRLLARADALCVGSSVGVTPEARGSDDGVMPPPRVVWSSSDVSVATVASDGTIRGVGPGETTIYADPETPHADGVRGELRVRVVTPPTTGGDECTTDRDCSTFCPQGSPGEWDTAALGGATNGGFCVAGQCRCCMPFCGRDPETLRFHDCYCLTCSENSNCTFDSNLECYAAEDACLYHQECLTVGCPLPD